MKQAVIFGVLGVLLLAGRVDANPLADAGETVVDTTVNGARWTGHTVGAGVTWVLVNTDEGLHWLWTVGHNQLIHPLVGVLTLGNVELSAS